MDKDKNTLEQKSLEVIRDKKLVFIYEVAQEIGVSRATFYNYGLDKLDNIKEALDLNRAAIKKKLREKWEDSDNPTLQIALYKLIGDDDESDRINSQKTKIETPGGIIVNLNSK